MSENWNIDDLDTALELDEHRLEVSINGTQIKLTRTEFRLLNRLSENPEQVFTRDHLINSIYMDHRVVEHRTVDSHIKNLRNKLLRAIPEQQLIQSVYGVGYKYRPLAICQ